MKKLFIEKIIQYDGTQLCPQWIYKNYNLNGDAIVSFIGEVSVPVDNMVDLADFKDNAFIYSPLMLNFIVEHFNSNLELAVYRQRMLICCIKEELEEHGINSLRFGDDLYVNKAKLTVSIATRSIVSSLIHVGINIETQGTPVKTAGLSELNIMDIGAFAENVMLRYKNELEQIYEARCKVRGIYD